VIAGPTIASTLARFGAEVISIDTTAPTLDPWNAVIFGLHANRGKRSLLANLKSPGGREILDRLLGRVDLVTINALDSQLEPLGLDPARLKAINPDLILCQLDAFGGPRRGPRSNYPGYDDLAQASTGVMARFGGGLETPEEHAHFGTIDVLAGFSTALAAAVALVKRARGGGGDVARSSLAAAGQLIQLPFMVDYEGRAPFDEPSGREVKGAHALYRCYEASAWRHSPWCWEWAT
jgi:crotonobetainyl-CoA:carnitine CoA-transferase CaiB-like acyl-CoA transferase